MPGPLKSIFADCFWRNFFCGTQKIYISEYVWKTLLQELGILLKCSKTFEELLAACNSPKNTGLPQFFFKVFWKLYLKKRQFPNKNQKVPLCWALWIQNYLRWLAKTSKTTFSKTANPMKCPLQSYILVRTRNFLFLYFTGVSH